MASDIDNSNSVSPHFLTVIKKGLENQGIEVKKLFRKVNFDDSGLVRKNARVCQNDIDAILNEAVNITNDDAFAVKLLNHTAPASNLLTVLAGSCHTLRELFNLSSQRYGESYITSIYVTLDESDQIKLIFDPADGGVEYPKFTIDFVMVYIVNFFNNLLDDPLATPIVVKFRRKAPRNLEAFEQNYRCPLVFNANKNEICFDKNIYRLSNPLSNKTLTRATKSILDDELKNVTQIPISTRTISYISHHLPEKIPRQEEWAQNLNLSVRNMQRQLSLENTTFNELLKCERIKLAKKYLLSKRYSITEISSELSFSDSSHFIKTFKQVTGITPKAYQELSCTDQHSTGETLKSIYGRR